MQQYIIIGSVNVRKYWFCRTDKVHLRQNIQFRTRVKSAI